MLSWNLSVPFFKNNRFQIKPGYAFIHKRLFISNKLLQLIHLCPILDPTTGVALWIDIIPVEFFFLSEHLSVDVWEDWN
jgi:hypothetical protein